MPKKSNKDKLLGFLDENIFNPILEASEEDYSEDEKGDLIEMKESSAKEKEKYHGLKTAEEIKNQFQSDIETEDQMMDDRLDKLNLPKLSDVEDEFSNLCEEMNI